MSFIPLHRTVLLAFIIALAAAPVFAADDWRVLPGKPGKPGDGGGVEPRDMVQEYLRRQVRDAFVKWRKDYEARTDVDAIAAHHTQLREKFAAALGGFPDRTPLNAKVTGEIKCDGYHIEKLLFESRPKHYVTGLLYVPDAQKFPGKLPGVLVPCGHSTNGKAAGAYQQAPALLALHGIVALCFDPIGQGERMQLLDDSGKPILRGTGEHTNVGLGSILLGHNTATFEVWDGMRCIDYLVSRPQVDAERIGCMGVSGGGTQTSYFMNLDERIKVAAPACYITNFERLIHTIGPQDAEQNIHGQLAFGMDHADYIMMRAPMPILVCAATHDFFDIEGTWTSFRYAKRLYTRLGRGERLSIVENDAKHNWNKDLREASVHWMVRWLDGRDVAITEPDIKVFPDAEIHVTPKGQTMLLPGARSVYDLNIDEANGLAAARKAWWDKASRREKIAAVREASGIRPLNELAKPKVDSGDAIQFGGYTIEKVILVPEEGITLPALLFTPAGKPKAAPVLYLHDAGKPDDGAKFGPLEALVKQGRAVLAVDLRGVGETKPRSVFKDAFTAYLLGRSHVAMRAEDVLIAARWLAAQQGGADDNGAAAVAFIATGPITTTAALHATALEPQLFESVKLNDPLDSWTSLIEGKRIEGHLDNVIHAALRKYDLPELRTILDRE